MTIILPEGTVDAWQAAHVAGTAVAWCEIDKILSRHASAERDPALRGDILMLSDVAWAHAMDADFRAASATGAL